MKRKSSIYKIFRSAKVKVLLLPVGIAVFLVLLLALVLNYGVNIARNEYEKLVTERSRLSSLEEKLAILQSVRADQLSQSEIVIVALPNKNPGLWAMSQLKKLANEENIVLKDVKLGQDSGDGDINRAAIEIISSGDVKSTLTYIEKLKNLAPINTVDSVYIRSESGGIIATTRINIFWSPLPAALPEIAKPIKNLDNNELSLLAQLSELERPVFTSATPSLQEGARNNPFQR